MPSWYSLDHDGTGCVLRGNVIAVFALPVLLAGSAAAGQDMGLTRARQPHGEHDVALDTGPLLPSAGKLVGALAAVGGAIGCLLYFLPARAVEATKRRVEAEMTERALTVQEEDRRRIARELHDGAGQALTAARLRLAALEPSASDKEAIQVVLGHLDEAMEEIRRSTAALAPPALAEYGLRGALERHCRSFSAASKIEVTCDLPTSLPELPAHVEAACYRIIQEAISNSARHSGAEGARVRLEVSTHELLFEVSDDGVGFSADGVAGFGLDSIRERVRLLGGTVELGDRPKAGSWLRVRLPRQGRAA